MRFIGPSIKVPPKRKDKEWKNLENEILQFRIDHYQEVQKQEVAERHNIEKRIQELKSRPPNVERDRLIKEAEKRLEEVGKHKPLPDRHFPD